jgi:hypothetical protein
MGQHIEELALKCGAWNQVYGNRMFMIDEHFDIEKFAQLIVQECAEIAGTAEPYQAEDLVRQRFGLQA